MQEINYARQESSARSSPIASSEEVAEVIFGRAGSASEDKEDEPARREYTCRVCDGPVERPRLVCEECSRRHEKEMEWESYLDFMDILDACHISKRARWHSLQGRNARHRKICVIFGLPFRTIRERCLKERRVSLKEAERMWKDFQKNKPSPEELNREGFDEVYFVRERSVAYPFKGTGNSLGSDYHAYLLSNFQKKVTKMRPHQAYCVTSGLAAFHPSSLSAFLPMFDFFTSNHLLV